VEAAKPRVAAGDASILAIAYEVGFNARSSFYTAFKRATGLTPTQYRERSAGAE
jgi:AraC-like DNA-binding protein